VGGADVGGRGAGERKEERREGGEGGRVVTSHNRGLSMARPGEAMVRESPTVAAVVACHAEKRPPGGFGPGSCGQ